MEINDSKRIIMGLRGAPGTPYPRRGMVEGRRGQDGARAEAAARLRHDLARYIRLSAPAERETPVEALRDRLRSDVLSTRSGPLGALSAAEVFDGWMREHGALFSAPGPLAGRLARVADAVGQVASLSARIGSLGRPELERLDELTREVAAQCRLLETEALGARKGPR